MPKSLYEGGKQRRHLTLSDHLTAIAKEASLSRSEVLERLIRSTPQWEGAAILTDEIWPDILDHSFSSES